MLPGRRNRRGFLNTNSTDVNNAADFTWNGVKKAIIIKFLDLIIDTKSSVLGNFRLLSIDGSN